MQDQLVGISHSCNYPAQIEALPRMTSTRVPFRADSQTIDGFVRQHLAAADALYDLEIESLIAAAPDIVVSQTLCDVCAVSTGDVFTAIQELPSSPTLIDLTQNTLEDVLADIARVGERLERPAYADSLVRELVSRRDAVARRSAEIPVTDRPRVAFLEWLIPPFNGGHWNSELVTLAGGIDLLGAHGRPSSTLTWEAVRAAKPDVVFVACCGFRVDRTLLDIDLVSEQLPNARVCVVDGNAYFSSPNPRLLDALEILAHALHPDVHPDFHPANAAMAVRQPRI